MPGTFSNRIAELVEDAIGRLGLGDDATYEIMLNLGPGQNGQPMPFCAVLMGLPGMVLGEMIIGTGVLSTLTPVQAEVDSVVGQLLEGLRGARSQQVSSLNGQNQPAPGKLIIP